MNVEYFISKRIVNAKENKNVFSRPIISLTIFAISLSVAIMIISLSILDGFQSEITNKVIDFGSHIQISNYEKESHKEQVPLELTKSFLNSLDNNSEIQDISKVIYDFGLIKTDDDFMGINLKGVHENYNFSIFSDRIVEGEALNSDSSIFISENISNKLKLKVSDKIRVYFPSLNSAKTNVNVRPFYVCGIFNTKMKELDENLSFVSLSNLQKLKGWKENEVSLIEIKVSDFENINQVRNNIEVSVEDYYNKNIVSIIDLYPQIFDWLQLQDINVTVIIVLMLVVALVNVIISLLILILEKIKFIGILKSLGFSNFSIRKIFIYNAMYLSFKGVFFGNLIAFLLLFIQYYFQIISLNPETYYMEIVPVSFDVFSFFMLNIGILIACFVAMIVPTIIITKISVVKAIRFE